MSSCECFICENTAESPVSEGDYTEVDCAECGTYRFSDSAVTRYDNEGKHLSIQRMRSILNQRRQQTAIPLIQFIDLVFER